MERVNGSHTHAVSALRWTAKAWSAASVALILAFIVGERSLPSQATEWAGFVFFPVGISVGMLLAWRHEAAGGFLTLGSLVAFYLFTLSTSHALPRGIAWVVFAAPGFLFVLAWLLSGTRRLHPM
jgi:hypothetical protein